MPTITTYQSAIDAARITLNDRAKKRYQDADAFQHACDAVREIAELRPDLFFRVAARNCAQGVVQTVAPIGLYILDVQGVVGGNAVTKCDADTLDRYRPNWRTDKAAPAVHWMPATGDQSKRPQPLFYLWPPAPPDQQIVTEYVVDALIETPPDLSNPLPLPDQLRPAIENYIVYRAESIDDEHVLSQRAAQAYQNFMGLIGAAEKARKLIIQEGKGQ